MRTYRGTYKDHVGTVTITYENGDTIVHPDTDRFDWGYGLNAAGEPFNPGPMALAEALLRDALGTDPTRDQIRTMILEFVQEWPSEQPFEVTDEQIKAAIQ